MSTPEKCRTCGEKPDLDGWDGECGNCADATTDREQDRLFKGALAQYKASSANKILAERKKADDSEGGTCD
jgi:hypothetical protein